MFNAENTKKQGDIGLGDAIAYFTSRGSTVAIPLTDSQDYDLIVDLQGILRKVQIKTTSYKEGNTFTVSLSTKGGNRSFNTIKKFEQSSVDFVYVLTSEGDRYLIPSPEVTHNLRLGSKYETCRI